LEMKTLTSFKSFPKFERLLTGDWRLVIGYCLFFPHSNLL
jgi:hypothetical protein